MYKLIQESPSQSTSVYMHSFSRKRWLPWKKEGNGQQKPHSHILATSKSDIVTTKYHDSLNKYVGLWERMDSFGASSGLEVQNAYILCIISLPPVHPHIMTYIVQYSTYASRLKASRGQLWARACRTFGYCHNQDASYVYVHKLSRNLYILRAKFHHITEF
jgi:hypothetical protein